MIGWVYCHTGERTLKDHGMKNYVDVSDREARNFGIAVLILRITIGLVVLYYFVKALGWV